MESVKDIRITDPFTRAQVEQERRRRGDATATKTAARLINERLAQLELARRDGDDVTERVTRGGGESNRKADASAA